MYIYMVIYQLFHILTFSLVHVVVTEHLEHFRSIYLTRNISMGLPYKIECIVSTSSFYSYLGKNIFELEKHNEFRKKHI